MLHQPEVVPGVDSFGLHRPRLVTDGIPLVFPAQHCHIPIERRREHHRLSTPRSAVEDASHCGEESHVGHPVRFVDHDDVDPAQVHGSLLDEVLQPPRRGNHDVDTPPQCALLGTVSHAAVDGGDAAPSCRGERSQLLRYLLGELSGRSQDQRSGSMRACPTDPGEEGEPKREGLARPSWGLSRHVRTGEGIGNRGRLDRERLDDSPLGERTAERFGQAEVGERA